MQAASQWLNDAPREGVGRCKGR